MQADRLGRDLRVDSETGRRACRALTVELFGVPGSGKTTVGRALLRALSSRGEAVPALRDRKAVEPVRVLRLAPTPLRRLFYLLWAAAHPVVAMGLLGSCLVPLKRATARIPYGVGLLASLRFYHNAGRHRSRFVLFDQGLLQSVWSMHVFDATVEPEALEDLLGLLKPFLPDAVVLLDIDPCAAAERIRIRSDGKSRFDRMSASKLASALRATEQLRDIVLEGWVSTVDGPVLRLDAHESEEQQVDRILSWLEALPRDGRRR